MIGCGELARQLLGKGLVDELRFWVHPAIWGEGTRPYSGEKVRMRLLDATTYDSGVMLVRYEPLSS
ncbi:MAG: dihydrofolate reductase family protein [Actinomycetota bacterium]|nr:dihydrofolate reductase family protein [Actinomycetota bacterium]